MEWIGAIAALLGTALGSWVTLRAAGKERNHADALAHHERQQDRKAAAYVEGLEVVGHIGLWVQSLLPIMGEVPSSEPPLPDSMPNQFAARAKLDAFGSDQVRRLWDAWMATVSEARICAVEVYYMRDAGHPEQRKDSLQAWQELTTDKKPAELRARAALVAAVREELAAAPGGATT